MRRTRGRTAGNHARNQGGLTWRSHTRPYGGLSAYTKEGFLESRMTPKGSSPVRRGAVGKVPVGATRWRPTLRPGWGKPTTWRRGTGGRQMNGGRVRDAHRPDLKCLSSTGELIDIERVTISSEGDRWKSTRRGNSLAVYPTSRPVLRRGGESNLASLSRPLCRSVKRQENVRRV